MHWHNGTFHTPSGTYLEFDPAPGAALTLRLRTPLESPVERVFLRCSPDGEDHTVEARPAARRPGYDCRWWEATIHPRNPRFHYRFLLMTEDGNWWFTAGGLTRSIPTDHTDFQILTDRPQRNWLDDTVFYQIFPDRFAVGNPANRVKAGQHKLDGHPVVTRNWGDIPNLHQGAREFYGGDLPGVTQKLPYISERLGANAIYLNPIFTAPSSHKYDVASYTEVDPHLGGEDAFLELREATRERDVRLVLDVVPNHCGVEHPWFQAALADPNAETAEYFSFSQHPQHYEAWLGIASLPKLNYHSQKLRTAMYEGPDAILRRWLKPPYSIDGWRIDVANMLARQGSHHLGYKVLRGMRRAVKATLPDSYLLGESFFDASAYLQGDQLDAAMNYRGFMMPLYHWLTGKDYQAHMGRDWGDVHPLSSSDLERQWLSFRAAVPWLITRQQLNLLGCHDTPRLLHMVDGDRDKAAVARFLLFTYPGVPNLYYGDELGVEGGRDPDNRRCMPWDESTWDQGYLQGWIDLIKHRRTLEALKTGAYQPLTTADHTVAFLRESEEQRVIAVAKRAPDNIDRVATQAAAIPNGASFTDVLNGQQATVQEGYLPIHGAATQLWVETL